MGLPLSYSSSRLLLEHPPLSCQEKDMLIHILNKQIVNLLDICLFLIMKRDKLEEYLLHLAKVFIFLLLLT